MLFDPAVGLARFMQLTEMALDFRIFILALGAAYFSFAWAGETVVFPALSRGLGEILRKSIKGPKQRKVYKVVQEQLRI
jgi:cation-transporting ATPase 13A3/4/5